MAVVKGSAQFNLPKHAPRRYAPVGKCIYCGSGEPLSDEHIIPYSAGGRWILPKSSCTECAKISSAFEGEFSRTIIGPLRMLYNMPTRRPKDRPPHLPLKVKYPHSNDWEIASVDRNICPFLVGLPLYPMPDALTGFITEQSRNAATSQFWIRGAGFWEDRDAQLQRLCNLLGATEVMPEATVNAEPFCLTLAKIAHSYATAELGLLGFRPALQNIIRNRDLSNRAEYIGGGRGEELPSDQLHDLSLENSINKNVVSVRIRILGILGTPTYHVVVGHR